MKTSHQPIRLVEVGPRDGLQNEKVLLSVATKQALINRLVACGVAHVECTAFVSPKWVPQMADQADVVAGLTDKRGVTYSVLVPNLKGLEAALMAGFAPKTAGVREIAVFAAASETFSQKNINASITESLARFVPVIKAAQAAKLKIRGYVSCGVVCPFEGAIAPGAVANVAERLVQMGCEEISLGDTIGRGTPQSITAMLDAVAKVVPMAQLAGHYHDTYGMAIANILASIAMGMRVFDASVAGLGGCPYAPGAGGNVATEDVVYALQQEGFDTGINLAELVKTAAWISGELGRPLFSKVGRAMQGA